MNTNRKNAIPFKILLFFTFVLSHGNLLSQTFVISGNIVDSDKEPIAFATVQLLFNAEHNQSAISDTLGNYQIKTTKQGDCALLIRMLGHAPTQKQFTLRNDTIINIVLPTDPTFLNEVTIVGKKDFIQAKADRYVVNIKGNIETEGKETTDILKHLPSIHLSNETLNIFGKSSVLVYLNDRRVRLEGQSLMSYLNSLPPDIINSVEIISTPPAQYEAAGNVGIIKIVTNKNINPGWKGLVKLGYIQNSYSNYMASAFANYNGKKMFFEGSITNGNYSHLNQSQYYSCFPDATISTFNPKKWNSIGLDAQASIGYNFNENTNMIVDFSIPLINKDKITDLQNETNFIDPYTNKTDSTIFSNGQTLTKAYTYNSELFFKHKFPDNKSYFTANVAYLNNYTHSERSFISLTHIGDSNLTNEDYYTDGSQDYDILTSNLDFAFPLFTCDVNAGFKTSFTNTSSNNSFSQINMIEASVTNKYNYSENIQALYYSMEKTISDWSFKLGVRSELTGSIGNSLSLNEKYEDNYINFFPSLFISNRINDKSNISFSYANRIERAPYQYLDPFKWYISKYDYAMGNPFLKPSYIRIIEVKYYANTFSAKLYHTGQEDIIGRYVVLDSLDMMNQVQKTDNFLNMNSYGINIFKYLQFKKLETVLQGNVSYNQYFSNRKEFSDISGVNGTFTMMNTILLNEKFQLLCNIEEKIPGLYYYRTMKNYFKLDIGFNFIHSKKGFEARLFVSDIFKTASPEYSYISGGVNQVYKNYHDTRMLRLVLSWRFGNWFNRTSNIPSPSNIEEKQRL